MDQTYLRGDLYYADLGRGLGSEQQGNRPVLIIQNDVGNRHSPTVIVAAISSKVGVKVKLPTHYYLEAGSGLAQSSIVLLEQIRTIDKRRLSNYIGRLDERHIHGINHALAISIGLIEPIPNKLTLCLCGACAENFHSTGAFRLYPVEPREDGATMCVYCGKRPGTDYDVIAVHQRGGRR